MMDIKAIRKRAEAATKFCQYCLVRFPAVAHACQDIRDLLDRIEKLERVREAGGRVCNPAPVEDDSVEALFRAVQLHNANIKELRQALADCEAT